MNHGLTLYATLLGGAGPLLDNVTNYMVKSTLSDDALCCFRANMSEKQKEQKQDVALSLTSGAGGPKEEPLSLLKAEP